MKVLFDYQGFMQKYGGVSRYHTELIRKFLKRYFFRRSV